MRLNSGFPTVEGGHAGYLITQYFTPPVSSLLSICSAADLPVP